MLNVIESTMMRVALISAMLGAPTTGLAQYVGEVAIVQSDDGTPNIRNGPSTEFQVTGVLQNDDSIAVRETSGNWARVNEAAGEGWVYTPRLAVPSVKVMHQIIADNPGVDVRNIRPIFEQFDGTEISFYDKGVNDLSALSGLVGLRKLTVSEGVPSDLLPFRYLDLPSLAQLDSLKVLILDEMEGGRIDNIGSLANLTGLKQLEIYFGDLTDIWPLAQMTGLESLTLHRAETRDITPLAALTGLRALDLGQNRVADLTPLAELTALEALSLSEMSTLRDLSPLANLTALRRLDVQVSYNVDISVLSHLTDLEILGAGN
ncbi:MAG: hypothetical protein ACJAWC_002703 [Yoonia sp.]|jgi:hypothetical protein